MPDPAPKPNLNQLLRPDSVAIVGASRDKHKIGNIVLRNLQASEYEGAIYLVNPHARKIDHFKVYPTYANLPHVPDLAIIAIPAAFILESITAVASKGTKNVVIFSAGFKETGPAGERLEQALIALANQYHLNVLGPNCLGFANNLHQLNATFGKAPSLVGNLRFISQSGAIASSMFDWSSFAGMGIHTFVTLGNKATLGENEILAHWLHHPEVDQRLTPSALQHEGLSPYQPIGMYLESIENGAEFIQLATQLSQKHPLFILKPGRSKAAQKAMQSHTGAIAGADAVMNQAFKQAGILRCEGIEDMFDLARAFCWENAPKGPKVAIISNAGGPAVMSTDIVELSGLELAEIDERTHRRLEKHLPRAAALHNPVDVLGDAMADRYASALDDVIQQPGVHAVVVILTPQVMTEIKKTAEVIATISRVYHKPIVCSFLGGKQIVEGEEVLNKAKIPCFRFPERAIQALAKMYGWQRWREQQHKLPKVAGAQKPNDLPLQKVHRLIKTVQQQSRKVLSGSEAERVLKAWGISTPPSALVHHVSDAQTFAKRYGWPVVLKMSSPVVLHKTEVGGVIVGINSSKTLAQAYTTMSKRILKLGLEVAETVDIQIQKQYRGGVEVILGLKKDPSFGYVLMFGAGGTLAELLQDRNLRLLPLSGNEIKDLVREAKIGTLLQGFRGDKPFATQVLEETIAKLCHLVQTVPVFSEIEINPVIVTHTKVWAVDGKAILI